MPWETIHEANPQEMLERREAVTLRPMLIMQGELDDNVLPAVQEKFAATYRAAGGECRYELFADSEHEWIGRPGPHDRPRARDGAAVHRPQPGLEVLPFAGGVGLERLADEVALHEVAAAAREELALRLGLDALGDDAHVERVRQRDDGGDDRALLAVLRQLGDEAAVDLQLVDREALAGRRGSSSRCRSRRWRSTTPSSFSLLQRGERRVGLAASPATR